MKKRLIAWALFDEEGIVVIKRTREEARFLKETRYRICGDKLTIKKVEIKVIQ